MTQHRRTGFTSHMKTIPRAQLLADMAQIVPWPVVAQVIGPFYPNFSELGSQPQIEFGEILSGLESDRALYDSPLSTRGSAGIDLGKEADLDKTSIRKFWDLQRKHKPGEPLPMTRNQ